MKIFFHMNNVSSIAQNLKHHLTHTHQRHNDTIFFVDEYIHIKNIGNRIFRKFFFEIIFFSRFLLLFDAFAVFVVNVRKRMRSFRFYMPAACWWRCVADDDDDQSAAFIQHNNNSTIIHTHTSTRYTKKYCSSVQSIGFFSFHWKLSFFSIFHLNT